jgi:hypothetical protein
MIAYTYKNSDNNDREMNKNNKSNIFQDFGNGMIFLKFRYFIGN